MAPAAALLPAAASLQLHGAGGSSSCGHHDHCRPHRRGNHRRRLRLPHCPAASSAAACLAAASSAAASARRQPPLGGSLLGGSLLGGSRLATAAAALADAAPLAALGSGGSAASLADAAPLVALGSGDLASSQTLRRSPPSSGRLAAARGDAAPLAAFGIGGWQPHPPTLCRSPCSAAVLADASSRVLRVWACGGVVADCLVL